MVNFFIYSFLLISSIINWDNPSGIKVIIPMKEKPAGCENGKGLEIHSAFLMADEAGPYEIVFFLQTYEGQWETKKYTSENIGDLKLDISSCNYTGNYFSFPYRKGAEVDIPDATKINERHSSLGDQPKFKIEKISKMETCDGVSFQNGKVFTPNGEEVSITVFFEKKDGHWRKKELLYTGSGDIFLDVDGCDLTGKYKSRVVVKRTF
ncbi:hypothetical protein [Chondrinema litorale]|uniref:hypothetical protein n=1 Tax=Chondrinema litorale TaxID=2994555 RepID=UPI0025439BCE|nr:hypothetical protein [Chondrinema litorale]UZR92507.1 hypothetical protein OQ292_11610 [Chondrinema litorale]